MDHIILNGARRLFLDLMATKSFRMPVFLGPKGVKSKVDGLGSKWKFHGGQCFKVVEK